MVGITKKYFTSQNGLVEFLQYKITTERNRQGVQWETKIERGMEWNWGNEKRRKSCTCERHVLVFKFYTISTNQARGD